jgi:hypothetical protein
MSMTGNQVDTVMLLNPTALRKYFNVIDRGKGTNRLGIIRTLLRSAEHRKEVAVFEATRGKSTTETQIQVTSLVVTFQDIGQPQIITAPAHAIPTYGLG